MTAPPRYARPDHIARPGHIAGPGYIAGPDGGYHPDQHQPDRSTDTLPAAEDEQRFKLSATQITASMAAAVTAALVGSTLGVAGTVIGAGLASVISVVGGAIFGHSILLTRNQVKRAVLQVRGADREPAGREPANQQFPDDDDRTVVIPAVTRFDLTTPDQAKSGPDHAKSGPNRKSAPERSEPRRPRPTRRKLGAGLLVGVAAAATIFAGSLAAVTLVETVKGSPLSGGDSGGLSVLGGNTGADSNPVVEVPVTTTQVTAVSTVTQTVTSDPTDSAPATSERVAPTSAAPTSAAPTSAAPTSAAPTSGASTSASSPSGASTSAASTSAAVARSVGSAGTPAASPN